MRRTKTPEFKCVQVHSWWDTGIITGKSNYHGINTQHLSKNKAHVYVHNTDQSVANVDINTILIQMSSLNTVLVQFAVCSAFLLFLLFEATSNGVYSKGPKLPMSTKDSKSEILAPLTKTPLNDDNDVLLISWASQSMYIYLPSKRKRKNG